MPSRNSTASQFLHRRYARDETRKQSLQIERVNSQIAQMIIDLRREVGLTQKQLADKIETTQSVVSRLEDAEYDGHSLSMLNRIATALGKQLSVAIEPLISETDSLRVAFREVLRKLRVAHGYGVQDAASKLGIPASEVLTLEQNQWYRPSPLLLHKLSKLYDIPQRRLAILCGAIRDTPQDMREQASRFAAMSESFSKLTSEERKQLDLFVKFLRSEE
jgi:transcriptional regulator with XRE-family HTH domain